MYVLFKFIFRCNFFFFQLKVLNNHDDFNKGKNRPAYDQISTVPVFKVIKQFQKRIVLIIDRSLIFNSPNTHLAIKRVNKTKLTL
jgi:hypothetical protein